MSNQHILDMTTITNSGTLQVMVADPNNPTADIRTTLPLGGGGGGGAYVGGLGIGLDTITNPGTTTINNTGTIVQPAVSGTEVGNGIVLSGADATGAAIPGGIYLRSGQITGAGTISPLNGANLSFYGGKASTGDPGVNVKGGVVGFSGGYGYGSGAQANPAYFSAQGGYAYGSHGLGGLLMSGGGNAISGSDTATGSYMFSHGGTVTNGTLTGGDFAFHAGSAGTVGNGGNITVETGTGAVNGVLLVRNIPTADPHILDAKFQVSVAGVGFVGVYSKG